MKTPQQVSYHPHDVSQGVSETLARLGALQVSAQAAYWLHPKSLLELSSMGAHAATSFTKKSIISRALIILVSQQTWDANSIQSDSSLVLVYR